MEKVHQYILHMNSLASVMWQGVLYADNNDATADTDTDNNNNAA